MRLYDSMTRRVEDFVPGNPDRVTMYVCGPTVYDTPHLGNARPAVAFDLLYRLLASRYPDVAYVRNLTDVDDKIIERAERNGEAIGTLTERTAREYLDTVTALGCLPPTRAPRATEHVGDMVAMIGTLVERGNAYVVEGHVLFSVPSFPGHGRLSGHDQADLRHGSRVEPLPFKMDPADFVLWKPSPDGTVGWDSPWGRGRPGWHVECSAMIGAILGPTVDVHAGGGDLRFPHHDCEISQSECANGAPLARYWLHNGMVTTGREKMAKSAGNFFTVRDLLDAGASGETVRLALLRTHYRSPLEWGDDTLASASRDLEAMVAVLVPHREHIAATGRREAPDEALVAPLYDDMNVPAFLAGLRAVRVSDAGTARDVADALAFVGLLEWLFVPMTLTEVEASLVEERAAARRARDYALSDRLRDALLGTGIRLSDGREGTSWWREPGPRAVVDA